MIRAMVSPMDSRDAFRVQQNIVFDFRQISPQIVEAQTPEDVFGSGQAMELLALLKRIDRDANKTLKVLADKNRLLGDYLQKQNQKIDLLARYCLFSHEQDNTTAEVSLSETGISFAHPTALGAEQFLAVRMIFLPEYLPLTLFARVVRSIEERGAYQIAAEFYKLSDQDRQELARQVFKAQVKNRQRQ